MRKGTGWRSPAGRSFAVALRTRGEELSRRSEGSWLKGVAEGQPVLASGTTFNGDGGTARTAWRPRSPGTLGQMPSVSVIVPCHNSSEHLALTLTALHLQSDRPDEVICVDDNSSPPEVRWAKSLARKFGATFLELPSLVLHRGRRSSARNAGTRMAKGDVLLYLDSDMVLGREYIAHLRVFHRLWPRSLLKGRRIGATADTAEQRLQSGLKRLATDLSGVSEDSLITPLPRRKLIDVTSLKAASIPAVRQEALPDIDWSLGRWDWCASNNLSARRELVIAAGGWDESFVGWGEEDMEFSYRMARYGLMPVVQLEGPLFAFHVEHSIDWDANRHSLIRNARYFMYRYPAASSWRTQSYRSHDLEIHCKGGHIGG
jgi:glycosyltransferase involved in cell wall biosynthesis